MEGGSGLLCSRCPHLVSVPVFSSVSMVRPAYLTRCCFVVHIKQTEYSLDTNPKMQAVVSPVILDEDCPMLDVGLCYGTFTFMGSPESVEQSRAEIAHVVPWLKMMMTRLKNLEQGTSMPWLWLMYVRYVCFHKGQMRLP